MMRESTDPSASVIIGIDTHADAHHLAVIMTAGRRLKDLKIPATSDGYRRARETAVDSRRSIRSALSAPAATTQRSPENSPPPTTALWRSTGPIGLTDVVTARPTNSTPTPLRKRCYQGERRPSRKVTMAWSNPYGC